MKVRFNARKLSQSLCARDHAHLSHVYGAQPYKHYYIIQVCELVSKHQVAQWVVCVAQLVRPPARRPGDPGSNPGPGKNFSLKLLIYDLPDGYSES